MVKYTNKSTWNPRQQYQHATDHYAQKGYGQSMEVRHNGQSKEKWHNELLQAIGIQASNNEKLYHKKLQKSQIYNFQAEIRKTGGSKAFPIAEYTFMKNI
jgi:hypothetical protein